MFVDQLTNLRLNKNRQNVHTTPARPKGVSDHWNFGVPSTTKGGGPYVELFLKGALTLE